MAVGRLLMEALPADLDTTVLQTLQIQRVESETGFLLPVKIKKGIILFQIQIGLQQSNRPVVCSASERAKEVWLHKLPDYGCAECQGAVR